MDSHLQHSNNLEAFLQAASDNGKQIQIKQEFEVNNEVKHDCDLIISLGGDRTYIRAQALA